VDLIFGLDIGGTSLKLGAWRFDGTSVSARSAWREGLPVPATAEPGAIVGALAEHVHALAAELDEQPAALGIGSAGLITDGVIIQSPNTPWDHLPLVAPLAARLGFPVALINDADAFLLGALAHRGTLPHGAIGITLGTGIGFAVWLHDRLLAGGSGISPEGGHITLDMFGELANTGIPGSWEGLASRDALLRYYEERGGPKVSEAVEVARAADAETDDGPARGAWHRYGHCVGVGLGSLCNLFSPQLILIGGGLAGAHRLYHEALGHALHLHKLKAMPMPQIVYVDDAPDTVALGGALQAALELAAE
jgi:glucokinase